MLPRNESLFACVLILFSCTFLCIAQERPRSAKQSEKTATQETAEDTVRIATRVVFIDTLVKDKRTGQSVKGLTREDFQVLDNGKPRTLAYFSDDNNRRARPLALLLAFDPTPSSAGKHLRRPEIIQSLIAALVKLPPEYEVAVMTTFSGKVFPSLASIDLTHDRAKVSAALKALPAVVDQLPVTTIPFREDAPIEDVVTSIQAKHPNSQVAMILVTDSIYPLVTNDIAKTNPAEITAKLNQANVSLSSLTTGTSKFFTLLYPLFKMGEAMGEMKVYGVPQYFARETGGDVVKVRKPEEYGTGLEQLIGTLTARYSLGFTLDEGEHDDGQMHRLEVKVTARDAHGKERKLVVSARHGYYTPKQ